MSLNIALNLVSLLIRVGGGIVSLVLVAKLLPVEDFGHASIALAIAALVTLPANYGLNVLVLKDGALQGDGLPSFLRSVVNHRIWLGGCAIALVVLLGGSTWQHWPALALMTLAILLESLMDVFICGLRTRGDYRSEITWGTWLVAANLVAVLALCSLWPTALGYASALLLSKVVVSVAFFFKVDLVARVAAAQPSMGIAQVARKSWANFVELGSQTLLIQIDSLIIAAMAGTQQVAVYQAVMRLVHGASQLTSVMLNVALPKAGALVGQADQGAYLRKVLLASAATGVVVGGCMALAGKLIGDWIYAGKFGDISLLCALAGAFLGVRYLGAGLGIAMIARGQTADRVVGIALAVVCVLALGIPLSDRYGAVGMMGTMAVAYLVLTTFALYRVRGASK
jgi:O-antigen/teichoic acid export membrane protein